jgi:hypothetical protein
LQVGEMFRGDPSSVAQDVVTELTLLRVIE